MKTNAKFNNPKSRKKDKKYVPYSEWSQDIIKMIGMLTDECLDRYKEDKKTNTAILKMLSKLQTIIEKKYTE